MECGVALCTPTLVTCLPGTPITVLAAASATNSLELESYSLSFDGVNNTFGPALVEVCYNTLANAWAAGTVDAGHGGHVYGRLQTLNVAGLYGFTVEPTVNTVLDSFEWSTTCGKPLRRTYKRNRRPACDPNNALTLRITMANPVPTFVAPTPPSFGGAVGVRSTMTVVRA